MQTRWMGETKEMGNAGCFNSRGKGMTFLSDNPFGKGTLAGDQGKNNSFGSLNGLVDRHLVADRDKNAAYALLLYICRMLQ